MSTGMFEGIEPQPMDSQSYAPGQSRGAHPLMRELVEDFLRQGEHWSASKTAIFGQTYASLIGPRLAEWPDPNAFLDEVIHAAATQALTANDAQQGSLLVNEIVQGLYRLGGNGFAVDLTPLSYVGRTLPLGMGLVGTPERPLVAEFIAMCAVPSFGNYSQDVRLTLRGETGEMSIGANHAAFTVLGRADVNGIYPDRFARSSCTTYHLASPDYDNVLRASTFTDSLEATAASLLRKRGFFKMENRLFVPDAGNPGQWTEVLP